MTAFIFIIALLYAVGLNSYFGGNFLPQSPEEVIADGILALILCIALIANIIEKYIKEKKGE